MEYSEELIQPNELIGVTQNLDEGEKELTPLSHSPTQEKNNDDLLIAFRKEKQKYFRNRHYPISNFLSYKC